MLGLEENVFVPKVLSALVLVVEVDRVKTIRFVNLILTKALRGHTVALPDRNFVHDDFVGFSWLGVHLEKTHNKLQSAFGKVEPLLCYFLEPIGAFVKGVLRHKGVYLQCAFVCFLKLCDEGGISQVLDLFHDGSGSSGGKLEFVLDEGPLRTGRTELRELLCVIVSFVH